MWGWRVLLAVMGAFALLGAADAHACRGGRTRLRADNARAVSRTTLCLVNRRRHRAGLGHLRPNARLAAAATLHSHDMVLHSFFEHDGSTGDTLLTRARASGYLAGLLRAAGLGEALGRGPGRYGTPRVIVRGWMRSPPHRAIVLSSSARDAGVGVALGTPEGTRGATYTLDVGYRR